MRQKLISAGASELSYEIRAIVRKARELQKLGKPIYWENIGDPIQKNWKVPEWIMDITSGLMRESKTYGYCDSMGVPETREFLADRTNKLGKAQISVEDILFFNGLGDGIAKLYQFILPTSRIIGPTPAYSTHSAGEGAHANAHPLTYKLDPENNWYPDLDDLYNKVRYNPNIVGILIINPDNPTGMVYPHKVLKRMVEIAREFDLFLISDEIYTDITYNGTRAYQLAEIIEDVPGMAMKGISKELPWPGARCGWIEFYNKDRDKDFLKLFNTLVEAKMLEVCSTILPQLSIPKIFSHPEYHKYRKESNKKIGKRAKQVTDYLGDIPYITFNETSGAFYNTIIFNKDVLNSAKNVKTDSPEVKSLLNTWLTEDMEPDKRFVYSLLASTGVCVVPLSSFASKLRGFRVTLLEQDDNIFHHTFNSIREGILNYCAP